MFGLYKELCKKNEELRIINNYREYRVIEMRLIKNSEHDVLFRIGCD
jgi:hypothetical protein